MFIWRITKSDPHCTKLSSGHVYAGRWISRNSRGHSTPFSYIIHHPTYVAWEHFIASQSSTSKMLSQNLIPQYLISVHNASYIMSKCKHTFKHGICKANFLTAEYMRKPHFLWYMRCHVPPVKDTVKALRRHNTLTCAWISNIVENTAVHHFDTNEKLIESQICQCSGLYEIYLEIVDELWGFFLAARIKYMTDFKRCKHKYQLLSNC